MDVCLRLVLSFFIFIRRAIHKLFTWVDAIRKYLRAIRQLNEQCRCRYFILHGSAVKFYVFFGVYLRFPDKIFNIYRTVCAKKIFKRKKIMRT